MVHSILDAVPGESRIPVFGYRLALKDPYEEFGQIIHHTNRDKTLNTPESGTMANHKNPNELKTDGEPGNCNDGMIDNFQN